MMRDDKFPLALSYHVIILVSRGIAVISFLNFTVKCVVSYDNCTFNSRSYHAGVFLEARLFLQGRK